MELSTAGVAAQSQSLIQNQVSVSVLKKSLDISAQQGADLVKIMDQAGGLGQRLDLRA